VAAAAYAADVQAMDLMIERRAGLAWFIYLSRCPQKKRRWVS
jgi:hypothetical protein